MTPNARQKPLDPAADAALLLLRIGFATLALALPVASLVSRRAAVVLVPIGVVLLVIAALIEEPGWFGRHLRRAALSRPGFCMLFIVFWAILSLAWSPFTQSATEKAGNLFLAVALGLVGAAALPERMRSANLNLVALGTGIAALFALALVVGDALPRQSAGRIAAGGSLSRGVAVVVITVWPALAWLLSRERGVSALALAFAVGLVAVLHREEGTAMAAACGAVAFGAVAANRRLGLTLAALLLAGPMLLAPLLPFLLRPLAAALPDRFAGSAASLSVWAEIVGGEPVRLVTGHGLDTVLRGRITGWLPPETPQTILFETWYELGLVGAAAASLGLFFAVRAAGRMPGPLAAGGVAAYVAAYSLAVFGYASLQSWWLMTLAAVALLFSAIARGQYRTERPLAPEANRRRPALVTPPGSRRD